MNIRYKIGSWVAGALPGFEEGRDFYAKLAAIMSWAPVPAGTLKGFLEVSWAPTVLISCLKSRQKTEGAAWVPMMAKGMLDFYETYEDAKGLPMLLSFHMRSGATPAQKRAAVRSEQRTQSTKGGRVLPPSAGNSGPSFEVGIRTMSYSTKTLDPSLFRVPPGYTLSPSSQWNMWIASIGRNGVLLPLSMREEQCRVFC